MKPPFSLLSVFLGLLFAVPALVWAVDAAQLESDAQELFSSTMSPFCPGRLLNDCPSSAAHELKVKIRQKLAGGESKQELMNYLLTLYGEEVRAAPEYEGFGRVAWLATPLFVFIGIGLISLWVQGKSKVSIDLSSTTKLDAEMEKRIQDELRKT